jgi:hypothetical protein
MTLDITRPELDVAEVIERVTGSPLLAAEDRGGHVCLRSTLTNRVFAVVDVTEHELSVDVPGELVAPLLDRHARLRPAPHGVCLALRDRASLRTAEAVLRWRIGLQLYARQARAASP